MPPSCSTTWDPSAPFDLVESFGAQLPSLVITELLGVDLADRSMVKGWIDQVFHIEPGIGMVNDVSFTAGIALHEYLAARIDERRAEPRDDLLTALVQAEVAGPDGTTHRLTTSEAARFANLLISAGTETVARLIGWAAVALDEHPDERAALVADPSLVPERGRGAAALRGALTGPGSLDHRRGRPCTAPPSRPAARCCCSPGRPGATSAATPTPTASTCAGAFDRQVSFGYGIHFCIGAALARLEGRIALEELLAPPPDLDRRPRAGRPPPHLHRAGLVEPAGRGVTLR